jgi:hypothetical protein
LVSPELRSPNFLQIIVTLIFLAASDDSAATADTHIVRITNARTVLIFPSAEARNRAARDNPTNRCDRVSNPGKRFLSFGRRLYLPDQESAEIRMWEYPQRVVGGDLPALTKVWLRFLPRPVQALLLLRTELQQGKTAWI